MQEIFINSNDQTKIHLMYVPGRIRSSYLIMVLPGMMNTAENMYQSLEIKGYPTVFCSFRGRGKSGDSNSDYQYFRYIEDIEAIINYFQKEVILIGHSVGGLFALKIASNRHPQVKGIIVIDPVLEYFHYTDKWAAKVSLILPDRKDEIRKIQLDSGKLNIQDEIKKN